MVAPVQLDIGTEEIVESLVAAGITVAVFVVAFVLLYVLGKWTLPRIVRESLTKRGYEAAIVEMAATVTVVIVFVLAISLAATVAGFGVVLSAFAVLGGALALAIGFAARDLIANFVAGIFILQDEPFTVDDWIKWDDRSGIVREIRLRVTRVETFDEELVTVPNSQLANAAVTNPVAGDRLRVSADIGIDYEDSIDSARSIMLDEAAGLPGVLEDPTPSAPVVALGDSAVVLAGRFWIDPNETGAAGVRAKFIEEVKKRFDAEGINMPYQNTELSGEISVRNID